MVVFLVVLVPLVIATATFDLVVAETEVGMKKVGHAVAACWHRHHVKKAAQ
jgi:hypothetical protein